MRTIITLYAVAFSYIFIWFQEFLHKHLLYTSLDFPTEVFEDNIHSTRSSRTQGGMSPYKSICSLDFYSSQ
jgi:hypothetical protein